MHLFAVIQKHITKYGLKIKDRSLSYEACGKLKAILLGEGVRIEYEQSGFTAPSVITLKILTSCHALSLLYIDDAMIAIGNSDLSLSPNHLPFKNHNRKRYLEKVKDVARLAIGAAR